MLWQTQRLVLFVCVVTWTTTLSLATRCLTRDLPMALLRLRPPLTRPSAVTLPPAFLILFISMSSSGLWSADISTAVPSLQTTHLQTHHSQHQAVTRRDGRTSSRQHWPRTGSCLAAGPPLLYTHCHCQAVEKEFTSTFRLSNPMGCGHTSLILKYFHCSRLAFSSMDNVLTPIRYVRE